MLNSLSNAAIAHFLDAISTESPCGVNLEDDPVFAQLELEAKGVPERQIGDSIIPEVGPDWKKILKMSLELLSRSRDIQVCIHLTCAWIHSDGFTGIDNGLTLINELLQRYWDDVYPHQEPDEEYPVLRINSLTTLNNYKKVLGPIHHIPLIQSALGSFSLRDFELSEGKLTASSTNENSDKSILDAAVLGANIEILKNLEKTVKHASTQAQGIVDFIADKTNPENTPDLSSLVALLNNIDSLLIEKIQHKQSRELEASQSEADALKGLDTINDILEPAGGGKNSKKGGVHSREDVALAIDAICKYFERYEPSSPIPFLLLRAKRLLSMNFMEILGELTPDAVRQAEDICGKKTNDKT